jgi:hypothetical protein
VRRNNSRVVISAQKKKKKKERYFLISSFENLGGNNIFNNILKAFIIDLDYSCVNFCGQDHFFFKIQT